MSTSTYIPRKSLPDNLPVIKGATEALKVDKDEIERMLIVLRKNSDLLISQASKEMSTYIRTIKDHAFKFFKTSSYEDFYKLVLKHFSDVETIFPNTISAFLVGRFFYKGDLPDKSYAPTCLGSIPTPKDDNILVCDKNITIVYRDNISGRSITTKLNRISNSKGDIVVLLGDIDSNDTTLYKSEKNTLKSLNIINYSFYTYYGGFYREQKPLKLATVSRRYSDKPKRPTNKYDVWMYLILVMGIIIILAITLAAIKR